MSDKPKCPYCPDGEMIGHDFAGAGEVFILKCSNRHCKRHQQYDTEAEAIKAARLSPLYENAGEMLDIINGMLEIKELWLPFDDPPPEHVGEYEALWSAYTKIKALLKKTESE